MLAAVALISAGPNAVSKCDQKVRVEEDAAYELLQYYMQRWRHGSQPGRWPRGVMWRKACYRRRAERATKLEKERKEKETKVLSRKWQLNRDHQGGIRCRIVFRNKNLAELDIAVLDE
jgi:hypothetical protein